MKKRQMKKMIPKDTEYCYTVVNRTDDGVLHTSRCPHYRIVGSRTEAYVDAEGAKQTCQTPIAHCSFMKVNSEQDYLLLDSVKTCGLKLPEYG